jgi:pyruvate dehydrogenase E2 component (dihydrolipoamide acetyltransferase)
MAIEIRMPRLSQTTDDVKLVSWLVKEGDTVRRGDPLCEVETDKATMPVESYEGGTVLKIIGVPDTIVTAGTPIAILGAPGEKVSFAGAGSPSAAAAQGVAEARNVQVASPKAEPGPVLSGSTGPFWKPERRSTVIEPPALSPGIGAEKVTGRPLGGVNIGDVNAVPPKATSLVRNIARKLGIDLAAVVGTGPRGLITKKDLEDYQARGAKLTGTPAAGAAATQGAVPSAGLAPAFAPAGELKAVSLSRNQMLVGRNLGRSKREAPHYYLKATVFMDRALKWREQNRQQDGSKVSIYAIFVYAAAKALKALPKLNGFFKEEKLVLFGEVNVGCAVTAGDDLFVPVIRSADRKGVLEIDRELGWLVAKVQNGKLEPRDLLGGTFTLTNLGMYPVDEFCAVINPPQAGVLAIARAKKVLHIDDEDRMSIRTACTLTGSFDHRVVNGAQGAEFLQKVKETLEGHIV